MREQLMEADRVKKLGQAALEGKGKKGMDTSEMERQDWDRQAVQRQMALAEQRQKHRTYERRMEFRGSGGDEQGIGGRIELTGGMEESNEEDGVRNAITGEKGSCFQLSSEADGSLEEYKFQKTVKMLEERMEEMNSRICVLEGNSDGEEKETSSDGGYEKDWRWDNGGWWLRAPLIKGNRVNARYRRKISRMVRQMLKQEEKKGRRQKWEWENLREEGGAESNLKASNLAGNNCTALNLGGNLLPGPGHGSQRVDRNVQDRNVVPGTSSSSRNQD